MKKILPLVLCLSVLNSCEKELPREETPAVEVIEKKHEKNIPERLLRIDGKTDTLRSYELRKHLFGEFFRKRAEFYVIENPNKTIYSHPVKSITLYFIDGTLAKTKYTLEEDISDNLIYSYGNFTIKGYDSVTQRLCKAKGVVTVVDHKKILNKNLNNFELKWELPEKFIYTRVDKTGPKKRFEYIESAKDFQRRYKDAEDSNI
jgi:hypothetical protein